ncbi:hypothetical protein [Mycoplasma todarodis]|uniref:hypothetical protein n=1 Tax=Mycoplasma todarodis TaxID=1937191 RepID=UPI003B2EAD57
MNKKSAKRSKSSIIKRLKKLTKDKNKMISEIIDMENKNRVIFEKMELLFKLRETLTHEISNPVKNSAAKALKKLTDKREKNEHVIYNAEKIIEANKKKIESRRLVVKRLERTIKELDRELIRQWEVKKFKQSNDQTIELILN